MELIVYQQPGGRGAGINPFDHGPLHTDMWKTEGLKQALDLHGFDAAFGGARRDEEKSRAKERVFSFRYREPPLGPEEPAARAVEPLQCRKSQGRDHPRLPALQLDRARHLAIHLAREHPDRAALLRRAAPDRRARRPAPDGRRRPLPAGAGREAGMRSIRFRTLGCYPLTGAVESEAATLPRSHRGNAGRHHLRAPGPGDRPRPGGAHGEEEAGGLFLMSRRSLRRRLIRPTSRLARAAAKHKRCCASSPAARSTTASRP